MSRFGILLGVSALLVSLYPGSALGETAAVGASASDAAVQKSVDLTGVWLATEDKAKTGSCATSRKNRLDRDHRRRHSSFRYLYAIEHSEGGAFAILPADPEERASSPVWSGTLDDEGKVRTTRKHQAYCDGKSYAPDVVYDGALRYKKGFPRIVLTGSLELCPSSGCVYRVKIVLVKQAAEPKHSRGVE